VCMCVFLDCKIFVLIFNIVCAVIMGLKWFVFSTCQGYNVL